MKTAIPRYLWRVGLLVWALVTGFNQTLMAQAFVHPGALETAADFTRMQAKVSAGAHPWIDSYNILIANSHAQSNYVASPVSTLVRGTGNSACSTENYSHAYNDAAAAYQLALRWQITGDANYANAAINILNAWSGTCISICGDSNEYLASGLYGYEFACAAEIMRGYNGWAPASFAQFQSFMTNVFYPLNHDFLVRHNGACDTHYWANWDLCNMASIMAIGILCDDRAKYNEAVTYFKTGIGNGNIDRTVYITYPGYLGQGQEEGRDQGHSGLDISLLGVVCEMAWNQGDDLFGYENNKSLTMCEYFAKYNLTNTVPYVCYDTCDPVVQPIISTNSQGDKRPAWDLLYNHWANIKGVAIPYTSQYAAIVRPEGGGGNYGPNSGGYDQLGYTTLTHTLDPLSSVVVPGGLTATANGLQVTLQWWGSSGANGYNVKRATVSGGPYTTIASGVTATIYADAGLSSGTTYYYVVSATSTAGETTNSTEASATASSTEELSGSIIGTSGSYNSLGNTITNVYDGSLINWFDGPDASGDWAGLDLGVGRVITQVAYCPRSTFSSRMVGGVFQGDNDPNFGTAVTLATVSTAPPDGGYTIQAITNTNSYRYVRYLGPANGYCNVADVEFWAQVTNAPPAPPAAPTGLSATGGNVVVNLSWTQSTSPGVTSNNVYRSTSGSGGPYNLLANLAATTSYPDTAVVNGNTYFYSVSAINANGESVLSAYAGATPTGPPSAPTGLTATDVSSSQINLSWTASTGATSYNVKRATVSGGPYTTIASGVTSTSYSDTTAAGGTTYYYVVSAVNGGGESANSTQASATTIPAAPTGLSATAGNNQVGLSWTASTGATSYNVKRATVSGGPYTTIGTSTTASYTDTTAVNGTTYYYVVSAVNGSGESANSSQASATPQPPAPAAPTGLTATDVSASQINLSWTASTGATSYNVKRATVSGGPYTTIASGVTTTSYSDTTAAGGTTYYYVVSGVNGGGEGANSTEANATTIPAAPTGLSATGGNNQVGLSWTASTGATSYNVKRATVSGGPYTTIASGVTTTSYTDTTAVNGTTYYYVVSAVNGSGESANSSQVSATPSAPTAPAAPTGLTASASKHSPGKITLAWTQSTSPNITTNNIYRATVNGGPYTKIASIAATTSYANSGLTSGTTYYYVVTAVNSSGLESVDSNQASATSR